MPKTLRLVLPHGLMLVASVLLYWAATRIEAFTGGGGRIGPDAWPKAIIVFMGLLCAWEIAKRLALRSRGGGSEPPAAAQAAPVTHPGRLAAGVALVFGYVLVVPWIGFFVSTALFLAAFTWFGGLRRPVLATATGLAGSLVLVVMFMRVAYISLPLGEGPFKSLSIALLAAIGVS
ncbi:MAG: tripartite tricarboxylate transporter TctB family protein [Burkholderiales bacterium]